MVNKETFLDGFGPLIPCLKEGQKLYTLTPEELSNLVNRAFHDGYLYAKAIYDTHVSNSDWDAVKETSHGTD